MKSFFHFRPFQSSAVIKTQGRDVNKKIPSGSAAYGSPEDVRSDPFKNSLPETSKSNPQAGLKHRSQNL